MSNNIANRLVICKKLQAFAEEDERICIVTSDSRGSASLNDFAKQYPDRTIEVGIAEQNLVGIAAGMAASGMKPYVASPACFLTMRSIEQIKVDVAYSNTNVKLIGISSGVSYGALGMTHHSLQDLAVLSAIPNIDIIVPCDRFETSKMMEALKTTKRPTYIRIGRNPVEDVHQNADFDFEIGKAITVKEGTDITVIATGEMVSIALNTANALKEKNISVRVINMHTIKPFDSAIVEKAARETKAIITMEEHSVNGGLGSLVCQSVCERYPTKVKVLGFPDEITIAGNSQELFEYYGLSKTNLTSEINKLLGE